MSITPIFSTDEYASIRLMSFCIMAYNIPMMAVIRPRISTIAPHHKGKTLIRSKVTRIIP